MKTHRPGAHRARASWMARFWRGFWSPEPPPVFPREVLWVTLTSTGAMLVDGYNVLGLGQEAWEHLVLYFLVPVGVIVGVLRRPLGDYGLTLGRWRVGLALTTLTCLVATGVLSWSLGLDPALRAYYGGGFSWSVLWSNLVDLVGWEFVFRGFLLFAYARAFGPGPALLLQTVPFALLHLGKPALETYSTLLGGLWLGVVAWRSRSVLYPFLSHVFISTFVVWAAAHLP